MLLVMICFSFRIFFNISVIDGIRFMLFRIIISFNYKKWAPTCRQGSICRQSRQVFFFLAITHIGGQSIELQFF
jgi:hypothetical protein